jgi:hypothetical protein
MTAWQCGGQGFESPQLHPVDQAVLRQGGRPESFLGPCRCADGCRSTPRRPPLRCATSPAGVPLSMAGAGHRIENARNSPMCRNPGMLCPELGQQRGDVDLRSRPWVLPVPVRRRAAYRRRPLARRSSRGPCPISRVDPVACRPVASRAAAAPVRNAESAARERAAIVIAGGLPLLGRRHPEPQRILHTQRG